MERDGFAEKGRENILYCRYWKTGTYIKLYTFFWFTMQLYTYASPYTAHLRITPLFTSDSARNTIQGDLRSLSANPHGSQSYESQLPSLVHNTWRGTSSEQVTSNLVWYRTQSLITVVSENAGILDFSNDCGEEGKRVVIPFGHGVYCAVVLYRPLFAILLCKIEEGRYNVRLVWVTSSDILLFLHLSDPLL
jgi:hypothetical protein